MRVVEIKRHATWEVQKISKKFGLKSRLVSGRSHRFSLTLRKSPAISDDIISYFHNKIALINWFLMPQINKHIIHFLKIKNFPKHFLFLISYKNSKLTIFFHVLFKMLISLTIYIQKRDPLFFSPSFRAHHYIWRMYIKIGGKTPVICDLTPPSPWTWFEVTS